VEPPVAPFKIVGYAASWGPAPTGAQLDRLTHVHYAFLDPNEGIAAANVPRPTRLRSLVAAARARGVKVLLALGGWTGQDNRAFESHAATAGGRDRFVEATLAIVERFGLDGIDVDWEWPQPGGTDALYGALMERLAAALHAQGKLCTTAVAGADASGVPPAVFDHVDFVSVMAYDNRGEAGHSSYEQAVAALDRWQARGLSPERTVLGVPFYGRGAAERAYSEIVARDAQAPDRDESGGVHYNGTPTMRRKAALARERAAGLMAWELGQDLDADDPRSLLRAVHETVRAGAPDPPREEVSRRRE
jgi:chitinase